MFLDFLPNKFDNLRPLVCIALTAYAIFPPTVEKYRICKPVTEANDVQKSADPLINLDSEYSLPRPSSQSAVLLWDGGGWLKKPAWALKWLSKHVRTNWLHTHLSSQPTMSGLNRASDPQLEEHSRCQLNDDTQGGQGSLNRKFWAPLLLFFLYYSLGLSSWFLWNHVSTTN